MPSTQSHATSFVGRGAELARLDELASARGVVVVTGPPGVGKSRLVAQWASMRAGFVARADLGAARTGEEALRRVAWALALEVGPQDLRVVERILEALRSRSPALLWLDDADAVMEAMAEPLARWRVDDALSVVITSRRATLALPHAALALAPLPADDAVALLVARARAVRPDFAMSTAQRTSLEELARRLDALPLALELLAPRLRLLSPAQLLARLDTLSAAGDPLRLALERSFELLQPWERDAMRQCAVFRDGFYLEAAESVIDLGAHPGAPDVLTVLEALVAQSLLRTEAVPELPDHVRIRHFRAVHEHASIQLEHDTQHGPCAQRHIRYFLHAAETWDEGIESPDEAEHTARLGLELPNIEAAYERSSEPEAQARLGLVLHMAYQRRGPFGRQAELVNHVCSVAAAIDDASLLARAELAWARVHRWAGDLARSDEALGRALDAALRSGDATIEASCARNLAANRFRAGDVAGFESRLEHALAAAARSGRAVDEVNARTGLGYLHGERGELDRAQSELERALRLALDTRIPGLIALVHGSLSALMLRAERLDEAERHASAAIARYEALGYLRQWAHEHLVRGRARWLSGAMEGASEDARAALERARWLGLEGPIASALALSARVAFAQQDFAGARELAERALGGERHADAALAWAYAGASCAMLGHLAAARDAFERAGDDEVASTLRGFLALAAGEPLGLAPARSAEARRVRAVLEAVLEARGVHDAHALRLEVADDGRWFRLEGAAGVDLTRRRALRAVLAGLIEQHRRARGEPLSVDAVLDAGWPGERMSPDSGARRVYVTINRLRRLGLEDLLLTTGDGYMLAPRVDVHVTT